MSAKLRVDRGTTYTITLTYPNDLTSAKTRFTVKTVEYDEIDDDSTAILKKTITGGTEQTDGTWQVEITLTPDDTEDILPDSYYYDIKVDEAGDAVTVVKVIEGRFVLDGSPTNRLS
jgi:hypothetical protein